MNKTNRFGEQIPFCEPYWYQGFHSPYYRESHMRLRKQVRDFVEKELKPNMDEWIASRTGYPAKVLHRRAYELGLAGLIYPREYGYVSLKNSPRLLFTILHTQRCETGRFRRLSRDDSMGRNRSCWRRIHHGSNVHQLYGITTDH